MGNKAAVHFCPACFSFLLHLTRGDQPGFVFRSDKDIFWRRTLAQESINKRINSLVWYSRPTTWSCKLPVAQIRRG